MAGRNVFGKQSAIRRERARLVAEFSDSMKFEVAFWGKVIPGADLTFAIHPVAESESECQIQISIEFNMC